MQELSGPNSACRNGRFATGTTLVAAAALLGFGPRVLAHHGNAAYELQTFDTVQGVVIEHAWINPHGYIKLRTTGSDGGTRELEIETVGASTLNAFSVARDAVQAGDRVVVRINPSRRSPSTSARGVEVVKEDGTIIALDGRPRENGAKRGPTGKAQEIFGTWVPQYQAFASVILGRASWPLTPKAREGWEAWDVALSSQAECVPVSPPTLMVYPNVNTIERAGDRIVMRIDWMNAVREIYTDGRSHPPIEQRFLHGHSVGRWEDKTLVIDTRNFADSIDGNSFGIASGAQKHLVERFELADEGAALRYAFVLEDPEYLAAPVNGDYQWDYRPDLKPSAVVCDVAQAGRFRNEP